MTSKYPDHIVLIKGAGDLATGVAARLYRCGFVVVMTERPNPLMVRRSVSFGEAVYATQVEVEGILAWHASDLRAVHLVLDQGNIPVVVDPQADCKAELLPTVLVDAIMAKSNLNTRITDAPCVVALGPGFTAGVDCHAVIETNRGHSLGRVIYTGSAEPDTGQPGSVDGKTEERILLSPVQGVVVSLATIGDRVTEGQTVAQVSGRPVYTQTAGILRGLIHSGICIPAGTKIGDVDPRAEPAQCQQISDKAYAIAGGVLEAVLRAGILPTRLSLLPESLTDWEEQTLRAYNG
ncbi:MAG: selenium-dependent molybdenum cofactor biosynthesis protein YqeB [Anaerolineales bacterium]